MTWHEITSSDQSGSVPIGRPISNVKIFLLDCHLNQVPVGVPGELYVEEMSCAGIPEGPELSSERFIVYPFGAGSSIRLFRTGDLGCYLPNGEIEYLGRTDHQVKIRGVRVELGEIEAVLASQPKIRDAVVILADRSGQQRLTAYFEVRPGLYPDVEELRRFMKSRLPDPMVPSEYLVSMRFRCSQAARLIGRPWHCRPRHTRLVTVATLLLRRQPRNALQRSGVTC